MTLQLLDLIAANWYAVFGSGYIVAMVVLAFLCIIMFAYGFPKTAITVIIAPVILAIATYPTIYLQIARWVGYLIWVGIGFIVAAIFWAMLE